MKGGYTGNNILVLDVYLNENGPSIKTQLLDIFKDHRIVAYSGPRLISHDKWLLSNALWTKFYNDHGKCKTELSEYFQMYWC